MKIKVPDSSNYYHRFWNNLTDKNFATSTLLRRRKLIYENLDLYNFIKK